MYSGSFKPQNNEASNRRPLTPFLSFGQLSPFEAIGDDSLTSPLLLSPPLQGRVFSPPPRKQGDGYFGPNTQQRTRKKSRTISGPRSQYPPRETGFTSVNQLMEHHDSMTESIAEESNHQKVRDFRVTKRASPFQETLKRPLTVRFETFPRTGFPKSQHDLGGHTTKNKAHIHQSIAMNSLRRFSEDCMHSEALDPPELLQSIASMLKMLFTSNTSGAFEKISDKDETIVDEVPQTKNNPRMSRATRNRRRAGPEESKNPIAKLDIPATITLRKASEVCQSEPKTGISKEAVAAEIIHEDSPALRAAVRASAFQNKDFDSRCLPSFEGREARKVSFARGLNNGPEAQRQRAKSVAGLSGNSKVRRQSLLAETTVTAGEINVDPGTFTVSLKSRRHSSSAVATLRRMSTIRAGLRGSVHEIIWQEDEPSSGTSSLPSISPTRKDSLLGSTSHGAARQPGEAEHIGTELNSWPKAISRQDSFSESKPNLFQDAVLRFKQSYGNIFNWSWDERHLGQAQLHSQSTDLSTTTSSGITSKRPSMAQASRIQSFPPLRPRSHTSEWRKSPLPDLNDPTIGRAPDELLDLKYPDGYGSLMDRGLEMYSSIPNAVSASVDSDVEVDLVRNMANVHSRFPQLGKTGANVDSTSGFGAMRSKSVSHASLAPARLAGEGKVGSAIGVSSHKRVGR